MACWNAASIALGSVKHACRDAGSHWNVDMFGEARAGKANAPAAEEGRRLRTSTATRALELCTRLATARDLGNAFHESAPTGSAAPIAGSTLRVLTRHPPACGRMRASPRCLTAHARRCAFSRF